MRAVVLAGEVSRTMNCWGSESLDAALGDIGSTLMFLQVSDSGGTFVGVFVLVSEHVAVAFGL